MLSALTLVSLALFAQSITCLPSAISSDAEVLENFNLEPNGLSPFTTETGMLSSDLKAPSVDGSDAFLSNQLALNDDFTASAPPASQPNANNGCGEAQKWKRQTEGDTACPAEFREKEPGAALETPKTTPQDQQSDPEKPGAPGSTKKFPSWFEQSIHTRHQGESKVENYDSSGCPKRYAYSVCGIHDTDARWSWEKLSSVHDADLWDGLLPCGPDPRSVWCCNVYSTYSRQGWVCDPHETAWAEQTCWSRFGMALDERRVFTCIEDLFPDQQ